MGRLGTILSFLATLGLGLASLGIYGVIARTTAERTGEFGIRLSLGAVGQGHHPPRARLRSEARSHRSALG